MKRKLKPGDKIIYHHPVGVTNNKHGILPVHGCRFIDEIEANNLMKYFANHYTSSKIHNRYIPIRPKPGMRVIHTMIADHKVTVYGDDYSMGLWIIDKLINAQKRLNEKEWALPGGTTIIDDRTLNKFSFLPTLKSRGYKICFEYMTNGTSNIYYVNLGLRPPLPIKTYNCRCASYYICARTPRGQGARIKYFMKKIDKHPGDTVK